MSIVYRVIPQSICYDGEAGTAVATPPAGKPAAGNTPSGDGNPAGTETPPAATPPAATPPAATPPAVSGTEKDFTPITTQDQLNSKMAENRRNLQDELVQTKASFAETESKLQEVLQSQQFSEETTLKLQDTLTQVQSQLRTREQQAEIDKQKLDGEWQIKYETEKTRADTASTTLDNHLMERGWIDALEGDAHSLAIFLDVVRDKTQMVEGKPLVDLPDLDAENKPTISKFTPTEAVARMRDLPAMYGGLFKSNMINGIGGTNATGGVNSGATKIKLTPETTFEEFKQAMKDNPETFGM